MHLARPSEHVKVLAQNVILTQDGTHLGRKDNQQKVEGQVIKDRGTLKNVALSVGAPATGKDVLMLMKLIKEDQGKLPLVWQNDNEGIYLEQGVQGYLKEERVVQLLSRVRHPSDNGAAEIGIRELKEYAHLGKGVKLAGVLEAAQCLVNSAVQIDSNRPRGSKEYLTANDLAENMPSWYNAVSREEFYRETCDRMEKAVQGKEGDCARKAQRDAVFDVLEKYGLVERIRGGLCQNRA